MLNVCCSNIVKVHSIYSYQNIFRIAIWLFFLLTYSQAGQLAAFDDSIYNLPLQYSTTASGKVGFPPSVNGDLGVYSVYHDLSVHT